MKNIKLIFGLLITFLMTISCEEWLDVKPKTQVEASELLKNESGCKDALWGVYSIMTEISMYGRYMTYELDVMARMYSRLGASREIGFSNHNYASMPRTFITDAWQRTYVAISNLNSLIGYMEEMNPDVFVEDNYNVILGEAYGLRAFLHFDMLRLFAPSYADDPTEAAIPYVREFNNQITPSSTVSEAVDLVLSDLERASKLLRESDPMCTGRTVTTSDDNGYLMNRKLRFNYYAVAATMARAYLWKGDKTNAAQKAQEVIDDSGATWTSVDAIAISEVNRDRTFTSEQIFALRIEDLDENIIASFTLDKRWVSTGTFALMEPDANVIYPYSTDLRGWNTLYGWSADIGVSYYLHRLPTKLWQYEGMPSAFKNLRPMIRLPEMKLIVAECSAANIGVSIINEIRSNRGISTEFNPAATELEIMAEIRNEYHREFYCEGILWYYYKRLNMKTIPYWSSGFQQSLTMTRARYVWPMPDEEIEFGNRN